jgi:hypothetical protein
VPRPIGQKLLSYDRKLGARFVAGADEAGRGSLAGPLVVAGVLLDYECLRNHRVRPLASLNDSKQVTPAEREELFRAVVGCATRISVRVIPCTDIDRNGLHKSNLWGCDPCSPISHRRRCRWETWPASWTGSGWGRSHRHIAQSWTGTPRAPRSPPPRSSPR